MTKINLYDEVTARIIEALESGVAPWIKPWKDNVAGIGMPQNAVTGRAYSGVNVLLLWIEQAQHGYETQRWLTYKQATELGGNVRKGERGTRIVFASTFEKENTETGKTERIPFLKAYSVFNIAQCDGIDKIAEPPALPQTDAERIDIADAFLAATGATIRHGESRAYYTPTSDFIMLPVFEAFRDAASYYGTAFHELVHWTGNEKRLNREFGKRFGNDAYAVEELVAELGAAFLSAEFGFEPETQSAAYLASWLRVLKADNRAIITAASKASKACEFVRDAANAAPLQNAA